MMGGMIRTFILLATLAMIPACGSDEGAGGLSADESRQLNEAAAMLDAPAANNGTTER